METSPLRSHRPSFIRVLLVLALSSIVLASMHFAAPILNPFLFALVMAIILSPAYAWLRRKLPDWLALLIVIIGVILLFALLAVIVTLSIQRLADRLGDYGQQFGALENQLQKWLDDVGLSTISLSSLFSEGTLVTFVQSLLGSVTSLLSNLFLVLATTLFVLVEGPALFARLRKSTTQDNEQVARLSGIGSSVVRQFGLRAIVNLITGVGVVILLLILRVDFAYLWGILTFFLSYVPYIGLILAIAPAVLLALLQYGWLQAVIVIIGVTIINLLAENVLSPALMSRGLQLSPTFVFLSFAFWAWMLGAVGAFLAIPITYFLIVMFDTFPGTRWLANLMKQ